MDTVFHSSCMLLMDADTLCRALVCTIVVALFSQFIMLHEGWGEYSRPKGHYVVGKFRQLVLFAA